MRPMLRPTSVFLCSALVAACGLVSESASLLPKAGQQTFEGPVPRATCGPGSRHETVLQGQVPREDQESRRAAQGYACNMELVGHEGTNATWQMAAYEDCAYYGRDFPSNTALVQSTDVGVVVVDASDPARPTRAGVLDSPAMLDPHESLDANESRGLLGAVAGWDMFGNGPAFFDVYDVKTDCRQPLLTASIPTQIPTGHEGIWAPDGMTYYGSSLLASLLTPIDVTDPSRPLAITTLETGLTHGLSISEDGTRAYLAQNDVGNVAPAPNGLEIWDVSAIQAREPGAQASRISGVYWEDGSSAQHTIPVTIQGKPYVIEVDEFGSGSFIGAARIIDISDETRPFIVSKLKLEVHMPENQDALAADYPGSSIGGPYSAHYCGVPQREEPGIVGCSYLHSGLRIFDIRDPYHPREIAYFNPVGGTGGTETYASARPHFIKERREVWFTDQRSGFYIVRFTNGVWPFKG
jgi:hypothetical protein